MTADDRLASCGFELLDTPVVVSSDEERVLDVLSVCYALAHSATVRDEPPVRAALTAAASGYRIEVDGRDDTVASGFIEAVRTLNHELLHGVMLRRREYLYVHAGVVALDGRAVILPGLSQAGKSTLVLALIAAGARYVSDELLVFEPNRKTVHAYPRALKIRDACAPYFPMFASAFVGEGEGRFLRMETLSKDIVQDVASPAMVVAPAWRSDAEDRLVRLTTGATLLRLVSSTLNFGMQGAQSVDILARLVESVAGFDLQWSDPHAAARAIIAELRR